MRPSSSTAGGRRWPSTTSRSRLSCSSGSISWSSSRSRPAYVLGVALGRIPRRRSAAGLTLKDARAESVTVHGPGGSLAETPAERRAATRRRSDAIAARTKPGDPILARAAHDRPLPALGPREPAARALAAPGRAADGRGRARGDRTARGVRGPLAITDRREWPGYGHTSFGESFDRELSPAGSKAISTMRRRFEPPGDDDPDARRLAEEEDSVKRVGVTGAAGFIGSHLCERLLAEDVEVVGIDDLSYGSIANVAPFLDHPGFRFEVLDCTNRRELRTAFDGCDAIAHLAAKKIPRFGGVLSTLEVNVARASTRPRRSRWRSTPTSSSRPPRTCTATARLPTTRRARSSSARRRPSAGRTRSRSSTTSTTSSRSPTSVGCARRSSGSSTPTGRATT